MNDNQKTYSFNNDHNQRLPVDHWLQQPQEGLTLFVILYTMTCQWSKCLSCNLPSQVSEHHIGYRDIIKQIDYIFNYILNPEQKQSLKKIILSNNGSILDEETFSTTALIYFFAQMNIHCPNINTITIETRPEYTDFSELEVLSRVLKEGDTATDLEIAIGFEAFDDTVRNEYFMKGLNLEVFEQFAKKVARHKFKLKTYFMLKPVPEMTEQQAIDDIKQAIAYLDSIAQKTSLQINMHLNPTYVAFGTPLESAFKNGEYTPPQLYSVKTILQEIKKPQISIFVGLYDEGLAVTGGSFLRQGDEELVKLLERFNQTQDYSLLK